MGGEKTIRMYSPIQILQPLPLFHLRMQRPHRQPQKLKQRQHPPYPVHARQEDERPAGVAEEEIVEVDVLFFDACTVEWVSNRTQREGEREGGRRDRTFSVIKHSILHSFNVSTTPPSGLRSTTSGSGSRKSSLCRSSSARRVRQL